MEENVKELPIAFLSMESLEKDKKEEGEVIQKGQYKRAYQKNWRKLPRQLRGRLLGKTLNKTAQKGLELILQ